MSIVEFEVECRTQLGEHVIVVGNAESIGSWEPSRSKVALKTGPQTYPTWHGGMEVAPDNSLEFKFVILGGHEPQWEDAVPNRSLTVSKSAISFATSFNSRNVSVRNGGYTPPLPENSLPESSLPENSLPENSLPENSLP